MEEVQATLRSRSGSLPSTGEGSPFSHIFQRRSGGTLRRRRSHSLKGRANKGTSPRATLLKLVPHLQRIEIQDLLCQAFRECGQIECWHMCRFMGEVEGFRSETTSERAKQIQATYLTMINEEETGKPPLCGLYSLLQIEEFVAQAEAITKTLGGEDELSDGLFDPILKMLHGYLNQNRFGSIFAKALWLAQEDAVVKTSPTGDAKLKQALSRLSKQEQAGPSFKDETLRLADTIAFRLLGFEKGSEAYRKAKVAQLVRMALVCSTPIRGVTHRVEQALSAVREANNTDWKQTVEKQLRSLHTHLVDGDLAGLDEVGEELDPVVRKLLAGLPEKADRKALAAIAKTALKEIEQIRADLTGKAEELGDLEVVEEASLEEMGLIERLNAGFGLHHLDVCTAFSVQGNSLDCEKFSAKNFKEAIRAAWQEQVGESEMEDPSTQLLAATSPLVYSTVTRERLHELCPQLSSEDGRIKTRRIGSPTEFQLTIDAEGQSCHVASTCWHAVLLEDPSLAKPLEIARFQVRVELRFEPTEKTLTKLATRRWENAQDKARAVKVAKLVVMGLASKKPTEDAISAAKIALAPLPSFERRAAALLAISLTPEQRRAATLVSAIGIAQLLTAEQLEAAKVLAEANIPLDQVMVSEQRKTPRRRSLGGTSPGRKETPRLSGKEAAAKEIWAHALQRTLTPDEFQAARIVASESLTLEQLKAAGELLEKKLSQEAIEKAGNQVPQSLRQALLLAAQLTSDELKAAEVVAVRLSDEQWEAALLLAGDGLTLGTRQPKHLAALRRKATQVLKPIQLTHILLAPKKLLFGKDHVPWTLQKRVLDSLQGLSTE